MKMASFTGFFGTNSSGKTSILQALLLLKQTVESPDRLQVLNLGNDNATVNLGAYKDIVHRNQPSGVLSFDFSWKLPTSLKIANPLNAKEVLFEGSEIRFATQIAQNAKGKLYVKKLVYHFGGFEFSLSSAESEDNKYSLSSVRLSDNAKDFRFIRAQGRAWDLPSPVKCYGFPDQVNGYFQNAAFLSDLQLELESLFNRIYYLGPLRDFPKRQYAWSGGQPSDMGRRGELVIDAMLASNAYDIKIPRGKRKKPWTVEACVAYWLKELKLIHSFRLDKIEGTNLYRVLVRKTSTSPDVLISEVGFGVSQILPVIALCYYVPEGSIVIIEQPEIHLHPSVQAGLADVFIDAINRRNIQILLESHSEHLLKRLQRRIAEEDIPEGDCALYFCRLKDMHSEVTRLQLDTFGNITNWPEHFFGDEMGEIAEMAKAIIRRKTGNSTP